MKWKVVTSVMALMISICVVLVSIILQEQDDKIQEFLDNKHEDTSLLADTILENVSQGYQKRIKAFVNPAVSASREEMIKAFAERDRKQLLSQSKSLFTILQKENPYFFSLGWILPDNHVFLRVRYPEKFGDDIGKLRPDVVAVNQDKKRRIGFNAGIKTLQYRIVQPVFYNDKYIGALQFGISPDMIMHTLQSKLKTVAGVAILNEYCKHQEKEGASLKCSSHTVYSDDVSMFLPVQHQLNWKDGRQQVLLNGISNVILTVFPVLNYQNKQLGVFFVTLDIDKELAEQRELLNKTLFLSSSFLIIAFFILYYSYGSLIQTIADLNKSLKKKVKKRTEELAQQKEQMQAITENVPGVVFQFYAKNTGVFGVSYISPKMRDVFGLECIDDPALYLQTFVQNIHEDDRQSWSTSIQEAVEKQIPWEWIGRYVKTSGEIVWFEEQSTLTVHNDEIVFDGIFIDITEKKKLEAQKLESSLQKEQLKKLESLKTMAGAIAHRFNNAMMAVQGNLELMTDTLPADSNEYKMATDAMKAANGASQVGSMMLDYVGQRAFKLQEIPLEALVRECTTSLNTLMLPSVSLHFTPPERPLNCAVDPKQMKEVIENVLINAIESLDNSIGTIKIKFGTDYFTNDSFPINFQIDECKDGNYIFCQIEDSGHGISPENLLRIFEPFYTTRFVGRGLGLALTAGIMQSHHGAIMVESIPGQGTTVRVLLPSVHPTLQVLHSDKFRDEVV